MLKQIRVNAEVREEAVAFLGKMGRPAVGNPELAEMELLLLESRYAHMKVLDLETVKAVRGVETIITPNPEFIELENEIRYRRNVLRGV